MYKQDNSPEITLCSDEHKGTNNETLKPSFNKLQNADTFKNHIKQLTATDEPPMHAEILKQLIEQIEPVDFQAKVHDSALRIRQQLESISADSDKAKELIQELSKLKINEKHYLVLSIRELLTTAEKMRWGLCKNLDFIYLYNGAYWKYIEKETFQKFLGEAAARMGVPEFSAEYYQFRKQLIEQFLATSYLPTPEPPKDAVYINLKNGTFEISALNKQTKIRPFNSHDFLTYQLPFEYNEKATAPIFQNYLNTVLPDKDCQNVLAEFLGYVFVKQKGILKEEKALVLYGTGANGKSVFFEIVNALLGNENLSSYTLEDLASSKSNAEYYRAKIANKLVNYASEINGRLETSIFKAMTSGEPISARLPYGNPMIITDYAKLIFNCNTLPTDVEHSNAYFRRFLIIPFEVTIPEHEQDKQLHSKIIENELSGVFNWVLEGLNRLLEQKRFSNCEAATKAVEDYKTNSDSVKQFISENDYKKDAEDHTDVKLLYSEYKTFCIEDGFRAVSKKNFKARLESYGIEVRRRNTGWIAFVSKEETGF